MPRQYTAYAPDAVDCAAMCNSIAQDFGLVCEITTEYVRDKVQVIVRCRPIGSANAGVVQVQALVAAPSRTAKSLYIYQYSALLDCWHQCDRGVLSVAQTPIVRGWDGRPRTPERRTKG